MAMHAQAIFKDHKSTRPNRRHISEKKCFRSKRPHTIIKINENINMDSTRARSLNDNINMDITRARSLNDNINMDSTRARSLNAHKM